MAYADLTDVQERTVGVPTYTGNSVPYTSSQVWDFLEQTAAEIDGVLRAKGYSLPVATTATGALKLLEGGNADGAACKVYSGMPSAPKDKREQACQMWRSFLRALKDGEVELDAAKDTTQSLVRFPSAPDPVFVATSRF